MGDITSREPGLGYGSGTAEAGDWPESRQGAYFVSFGATRETSAPSVRPLPRPPTPPLPPTHTNLSSGGSLRAQDVVCRALARALARAQGERVDVAVDTRELHFFDLETGAGIYG